MNKEGFLEQFEAAKTLQDGFNSRLRQAMAEQPAPSDVWATRAWIQRMIPILQSYKQWGEAFLNLTKLAPPGIEVDDSTVPEYRDAVRENVKRLQEQLQALGAETST